MPLQYTRIRVGQTHHAANVSVSVEGGRQESAGAKYDNDGGKDLTSRCWPSSARGLRLDRLEVAAKVDGAELMTVMILVVGAHGLRVVFSGCIGNGRKTSVEYGVGGEDCELQAAGCEDYMSTMARSCYACHEVA